MRLICFIVAMGVAPQAMADDWVTRDGDQRFSAEALGERLIGQTVVFYDNGQSAFAQDGGYAYTYDGGDTAFGTYQIGADSTVCIQYQNGFSRCDLYVAAGERLVVITEKGERFPVRP